MKILKYAKTIALISIFSFSTISFTACNSNSLSLNKSAYEKIQDTLVNIKSYQSEATVKYISNKGSNEYLTLQYCKMTGEYRVEVIAPENVSGNITVFDGNTITQFNSKISGKVSVGTTESPERSEIFLTSFINNYLTSDEVSVNVANLEDGKCTVLEADISGDHPYLNSEKLWIDNNTLKPLQLIIYDQDGTERIIVTYNNIEFNTDLDDNLFNAQ